MFLSHYSIKITAFRQSSTDEKYLTLEYILSFEISIKNCYLEISLTT